MVCGKRIEKNNQIIALPNISVRGLGDFKQKTKVW